MLSKRVAIITGAFYPGFRAGGPIKSIREVIESTASEIEILVLTADRDLGASSPYAGLSGTSSRYASARVLYIDVNNLRHWVWALRELRAFAPTLLYLNSFWSPLFTWLPLLARAALLLQRCPVLIAPRGELAPGALSIKSRKKSLARPMAVRSLRLVRPIFHASSQEESDQIRVYFPCEDIILRPPSRGPDLVDEALQRTVGRVRMIHVGRLAPVKNLDFAVQAMNISPTPIELHVYGPEEDLAYRDQVSRSVSMLTNGSTVRFYGPVPSSQVLDLFADYDAFVMPTLGENFGHVIAESLAAGCPVLCSPATSWSSVIKAGGGRVVPLHLANWAEAMAEVANRTDPDERRLVRRQAQRSYSHWRQRTSPPSPFEEAFELGR